MPSGREKGAIDVVEAYLKANKMFRDYSDASEDPVFSEVLLRHSLTSKKLRLCHTTTIYVTISSTMEFSTIVTISSKLDMLTFGDIDTIVEFHRQPISLCKLLSCGIAVTLSVRPVGVLLNVLVIFHSPDC